MIHLEDDSARTNPNIRPYRPVGGKVPQVGYYHQETNTLYPIFIYHKSDQDDIDKKTVSQAIQELLQLPLDIPESK